MEIAFNKKTGQPDIRFPNDLSKKDLDDAREIARMMAGQGWKILMKYMDIGRESIIDKVAEVSMSVEKKELCQLRAAVLNGWRQAENLPLRIVARAEEHIKKPKEEETYGNDGD